MLSRECFVTSLQAIREQGAVLDDASKVLQKLSDFPVSLDYFDSLNRKTLLRVLAEAMRDENEWISWWLYEDVEKIVTWEDDGEECSADLTDADALYDFLVREIRDAKAKQNGAEKLEIVEIEIDEDLQKQVEEWIKPYGITMEELLAEIFRWCAEKPEEATAYLKDTVKKSSGILG